MCDKPKVYLLDDDQDDRELLWHIYEEQINKEVELRIYATPEELINSLEIEPMPDMIILDQNMPKVSGIEMIQILRMKSNLNQTKIVIFSTVVDQYFKLKAFEKGADALWEKPTNYEGMVKIFLDILEYIVKNKN